MIKPLFNFGQFKIFAYFCKCLTETVALISNLHRASDYYKLNIFLLR